MENYNREVSRSPTGAEFKEYSPTNKRFEAEQNLDDDQKKNKGESDDKRKIKSKKHGSSFGIPTDGGEPRRKSMSASIRRAFATRTGSRASLKQTKDPIDWNATQKYRRQSSIRQSIRRSTVNFKVGMKRMPMRLWDLFFGLGRDDDEDIPEIILLLREFAVYLIHLSIIWLIFGMTDYSDSYTSIIMSDLMTKTRFNTTFSAEGITFNDVRSLSSMWVFMYQVLLPILYDSSNDGTLYILNSSVLIGAPQVRQIRVKNTSCLYHPIFEGLFETCYDYYSKESEDKKPFGMMTSTAWWYSADKDRNAYYGVISSYGGSGYVMNFTGDFNFTQLWLDELKENSWIRLGTRAVLITFVAASQKVHCTVKLAFELPPTGGILPSSDFQTAELYKFSEPWSYFTLSCELFLLFFAIYYTTNVLKKVASKKKSILNIWMILDFIIISLTYVVTILVAYHHAFSSSSLRRLIGTIHTTESVVFDEFLNHQIAHDCCGKLLLFVAILKLFKFSSLTKSTKLICSAFGQVRYELLFVVVAAAFVTMGFAICGNSLFGSKVVQLRTVWEAFFSLLFLSVSSFDYYDECLNTEAARASYIFFPAYIAFMFLFFLNTCVALVVHGFLKAAKEMENDHGRLYLKDVLEDTVILILPYLRLYRLNDKLKDAQIMRQNENEYDAFVRILLKYDWQWREIRLLMRSHGVFRGEKLSFQQLSETYDDFWLRNLLSLEVSGHNKIKESLNKIENAMEYFETTLYDIRTKAEVVTDKNIPRKSRSVFIQR